MSDILAPLYMDVMYRHATLMLTKLCMTLRLEEMDCLILSYIALYMLKDPESYVIFRDKMRDNGRMMEEVWDRFFELVRSQNHGISTDDINRELARIVKETR